MGSNATRGCTANPLVPYKRIGISHCDPVFSSALRMLSSIYPLSRFFFCGSPSPFASDSVMLLEGKDVSRRERLGTFHSEVEAKKYIARNKRRKKNS